MKAKLIKFIERTGSANGASRCYILCFKGQDGKSYRSWTDDRLGNFKRWYDVILALTVCMKRNEEVWLDGLVLRRGSTTDIDADSLFKIETRPAVRESFIPKPDPDSKPEIERRDLE